MDEMKLKEAIASLMKDTTQRTALAELMVEYIQPNHITVDFIGMLLNTRQLNPGDALIKKVRKGIKVWTWVPGSMSMKSEITVSDRMSYVLDAGIVSVMANEWELQSGELGTIADIKREAALKLRDYYMGKVFTALSTVWTEVNTPDNFTDSGSSLNQGALEDMINVINDKAGRAKAIVGVRSALSPLTSFAPFRTDGSNVAASQTVLDEILRTGMVGTYLGVPVIGLDQIYDDPESNTPLLPSDKVLVVGNNVGEFILYGPERTKEWTDMQPTPPYWHLDLVQQFGLIVDHAEGLGVIKVG